MPAIGSRGTPTIASDMERCCSHWLQAARALIVATIGTAIGLCFTVGAAQVLRAQLYGVSPTDAGVLAMAASLLIGVAVLAALIPGIRAASVDPLTALRSD